MHERSSATITVRRRTTTVLVPVAFALAVTVFAQTGTSPTAAIPDNYYAAGNRVDVRAPVQGDVVVAGRQVNIEQMVDGDVLGAGWRVTVTGHANDDVRIAAGEVLLKAPIAGDLTVAGGDVSVGPQVTVGGRAWLTGGTVRMEGVFARELRVAGGTVQLGGEVKAPVEIIADNLEILPGARVMAPLAYKSPNEARIAKDATIAGPVTYSRIAPREAREARSMRGVSSVLFALHLFGAGLLFLLILPRTASDLSSTLRAQPGWSLLAGLTLLVMAPVTALVLIVSVLGLPVGVAILALYMVAILIGLLTTALCVGEFEAGLLKRAPAVTRSRRVLLLVSGVATLAILRAVPLIGPWIVFVSVLFGLGALGILSYRRRAPAVAAV